MRIFIGWDPRETIAWHVLAHSIVTRASAPVSVHPVRLELFAGYGLDPERFRGGGSTAFARTRWLTPMLAGYSGLAAFLDCDMLCLGDVSDLFREASSAGVGPGESDKAVAVVQHDHRPAESVKFLGERQTEYPRKNWSSVMVFHCSHPACRGLTPETVAGGHEVGSWLHRFGWVEDGEIAALSPRWNHLVDVDPPNPSARLLHYTLGGPWFDGVETSRDWEWFEERDRMLGRMPL